MFRLKREVELQRKRRLEVETRAAIADEKVAELSSKLKNVRDMVSLGLLMCKFKKLTVLFWSHVQIDGKWFSSKLGLNQNKTQVNRKSSKTHNIA